MPAYADYAFYVESYLGASLTVDAFSRLALRASEQIDQVTFDRAAAVVATATDTATIEKIKLATCAVAEEMQKLEASGGAVQSERIGNLSVTYFTQQSDGIRLADAARRYIGLTGLMYKGLDAY